MKRHKHTRKPWRSLRAETLEERLPLSTIFAVMHEEARRPIALG